MQAQLVQPLGRAQLSARWKRYFNQAFTLNAPWPVIIGGKQLTKIGSPAFAKVLGASGAKGDGAAAAWKIDFPPFVSAYPIFMQASFVQNQASGGNTYTAFGLNDNGAGLLYHLVGVFGGKIALVGRMRSGGSIVVNGPNEAAGKIWHVAVALESESLVVMYVNGERFTGVGEPVDANSWGFATLLCTSRAVGETLFPAACTVINAGWGRSRPSDALLRSLSQNPWQIYRKNKRGFATSEGGAAADLAGNAATKSTATGALSTAIPVAGAALTVATATGALSTGIALQGQIAAAAAVNGNLTTVIRLNGAALAQALAAAGITTEIRLAGAAQNAALMQGDLQAGSGLLGNAQALAAMQGTLTTQIRLNGAAIAQALAAAGITTEIRLAGAAQATANAAGALITGIPLVGAAQAVAVAAGSLSTAGGLAGAIASLTQAAGALSTGISLAGVVQDSVTMQGGLNATPIALEGAIASITSGDGVLSTQISMSTQALARALAAGDLIAQITFSGAALSQALAAGVLTGGSIALSVDRARRIARRPRNFTIRARRDRTRAV